MVRCALLLSLPPVCINENINRRPQLLILLLFLFNLWLRVCCFFDRALLSFRLPRLLADGSNARHDGEGLHLLFGFDTLLLVFLIDLRLLQGEQLRFNDPLL